MRRLPRALGGSAKEEGRQGGLGDIAGRDAGDVRCERAEEAYPAKVVSGRPRTPGMLTAKSDPESGALLSMSSVSLTRALVT